MIYLDNAATTKIHPYVLEQMMPYLEEQYGNPSTLYRLGRDASSAVDKAREHVAKFIGAAPVDIMFTSGGSEGNSTVIRSIGAKAYFALTTTVEHDSVVNAFKSYVPSFLTTNPDADGIVRQSTMENAINKDALNLPDFVSVMFTNNETGYINDVCAISQFCESRNAFFHVDAVQAAGCEKIDVRKLNCDSLVISSHKLHGPKGVGALFVRDMLRQDAVAPLIHGGHGQEFGMRGGTENVAGIVGFGAACELAMREDTAGICRLLRNNFADTLLTHVPDASKVHIHSATMQSPKILSITIDGVDSETLTLMMDSRGVCISAGSACRTGTNEPSATLLAYGFTPEQAKSTVRVSFSSMNTEREVIEAAKIMGECIRALQNI